MRSSATGRDCAPTTPYSGRRGRATSPAVACSGTTTSRSSARTGNGRTWSGINQAVAYTVPQFPRLWSGASSSRPSAATTRNHRLDEMPPGERAAGPGLQVAFEGDGGRAGKGPPSLLRSFDGTDFAGERLTGLPRRSSPQASEVWRPQRESNPRFGLERAASWATGRWGRSADSL